MITDIEQVQAKADSPEIQKAMQNGLMPVGNTKPRVYLCGHCQKRVIAEGQGICIWCKAMLEAADAFGQFQWFGMFWAIVYALLIAIVMIGIFSVFK
jgi:hypothetical protein